MRNYIMALINEEIDFQIGKTTKWRSQIVFDWDLICFLIDNNHAFEICCFSCSCSFDVRSIYEMREKIVQTNIK